MDDLINQLNIESETYSLLFEPAYVSEITGKTITIGFSNRLGNLNDIQIIGGYSPVLNDKGLLIYSGRFKLAFFYPQLKENMKPGSFGNYSYSTSTGDISNRYDIGTFESNRDLIITECQKNNLDIYATAAVLANAENETCPDLIPKPNAEEMKSGVHGDYYGRSFPQITLKGNYDRFNAILKQHFSNPPDIVEEPDAVYNRFIGVFILVYAAVNGTFTSVKLEDCRLPNGKIDYGLSMEIYYGRGTSTKNIARKNSNQLSGEKWENYLKGL